MKKLLKIASLIAVVAMLILALTGCGGNKLVGTMEEDGNKSKVVASFNKDDKLTKLVITYTYDSASDAKDAYKEMKDQDAEGYKIKRSGKKITVTVKAKDFAKQTGADEDELTKDNMKQLLKFMGYDIED
ncbi:MAG: hypothetical protein IKE91_02245 [Clostridia bacterium]|nr:hypothetical protein [Clostridia bacterium]